MINAYEVAIKLKAEDQVSGVLDKLIKYLGDASNKATELEIKLERLGKLFKNVQEMGGKGRDFAKYSDAPAQNPGASTSTTNILKTVMEAKVQVVIDVNLLADKIQRTGSAKSKGGHGAAHAEGSEHSGGAAQRGKTGKSHDGFVNVAGMGDTATSLNKLGKVLGDFSNKADQVAKVATSLGKVSKKLEGLAHKAGFDGVATVLGKIAGWMNALAEKVQKVAKLTKTLSEIAKVLADFAKKANSLANFAKTLSKVGPLLEKLGKAVGSDTLSKVGQAMKSLGGAFTQVMPVLQSLGQFVKSVIVTGLRLAGNAVMFLGRALMLTPIGLIVTAIAAAAYLLYKNWKTVGPYVMKAWEAIKTAFHVAAEWVVSKVSGMWNFVKKIFGWYVGIWVKIGGFVASIFSSIYESVTGWLKKVIDWLSNAPLIGGVIRELSGGKESAAGVAKHSTPEDKKHPTTVCPKGGKNIHVKTELHMDSRIVAETVTRHQTRAANRPSGGTSCFDGGRAQRPVGAGAGH